MTQQEDQNFHEDEATSPLILCNSRRKHFHDARFDHLHLPTTSFIPRKADLNLLCAKKKKDSNLHGHNSKEGGQGSCSRYTSEDCWY